MDIKVKTINKCYCEQPGYFYSGVPGILAHIEEGKITSTVERCDSCMRYETDQEATKELYKRLHNNAI